jgi:chitodextrinase
MTMAQQLRALREAGAAITRRQVDTDSPAELLATADAWPVWAAGTTYQTGDVVRHSGRLYKAAQAHTGQAQWPPGGEGTLALYTLVQLPPPAGETLPWTAGETVEAGDVRAYGGLDWRCLTGHTALAGWEPPSAPALWEAVG